jgi:aryl-alcohol dehydrogenase-like predicted oxidoreductase
LKKELESLKKQGLVEKIGVSVYANAELRQVISDENIDVIQLPYNLLDNQNVRGPYMEEAKLKNKEIHIRSVFLQGLLFMNENSIPEKLAPLNPYLQSIHTYCKNQSIDVSSLALSYAIYNRNVDRILIGVDDKDQLVRNIKSIRDLNQGFEFINNNITVDETEFLNPVNWK